MVVRKSTIDGTREYALSLEVCNRSLGLFACVLSSRTRQGSFSSSLSFFLFLSSSFATSGLNEEMEGEKGDFESGPATPPENVYVRARTHEIRIYVSLLIL